MVPCLASQSVFLTQFLDSRIKIWPVNLPAAGIQENYDTAHRLMDVCGESEGSTHLPTVTPSTPNRAVFLEPGHGNIHSETSREIAH